MRSLWTSGQTIGRSEAGCWDGGFSAVGFDGAVGDSVEVECHSAAGPEGVT